MTQNHYGTNMEKYDIELKVLYMEEEDLSK